MSDRVILRKEDRINYILSGVCDYYHTSKEDLCHIRVRRPEKFKRKKMAMVLLRDIADCSLKDINFALGYNIGTNVANVHRLIYEFRDDISFDKSLKRDYQNILKHLGL